MNRKRIKLEVYVDLDSVPGTFSTPESAENRPQSPRGRDLTLQAQRESRARGWQSKVA